MLLMNIKKLMIPNKFEAQFFEIGYKNIISNFERLF